MGYVPVLAEFVSHKSKRRRHMRGIIIFTLFVTVVQITVFSQDRATCDSFQRLIKTTYDFKPSKLTDSERDSKSAAMDRVWEAVEANPDRLLPCLRVALQDSSADKWFRFDGSRLLVKLDPSPESKTLQIRSYTDVDLDDVDLRRWVTDLALRGFEGFDVSAAGSRWLAYPKARYFLPEHGAYEVKRFQGALFIFGSMDESQATPALVKVISQPDHPGRADALQILMSQATPESLGELKRLLDASGFPTQVRDQLRELLGKPNLLRARPNPKTSREECIRAFQDMIAGDIGKFMELVSKVPDGEVDVIAVMKPEDLLLIRKVRRKIITYGNQHVIEYYNSFTDILMSLVWKPEFVR
jgi:hypothetical protein